MADEIVDPTVGTDVAKIRADLTAGQSSRERRIGEHFFIAAIGCIPWIGGFLSAAASLPGDEQSERANSLRTLWLEFHQRKLELLGETLSSIEDRFEKLGSAVEERIQSEDYLTLVRQTFRTWDEAETNQKRGYAANLVTNAAGTRLCSDDVVRLFIDWLDLYHEAHFAVIRHIYDNPGATRYEMWTDIYGAIPREDAAEADLFKLLIRDLSTGGVIRQERDTNALGQFVRKHPPKRRGPAPSTLESAFEDTKPYLLTELGRQFVHYTMNEVVVRLSPASASTTA